MSRHLIRIRSVACTAVAFAVLSPLITAPTQAATANSYGGYDESCSVQETTAEQTTLLGEFTF